MSPGTPAGSVAYLLASVLLSAGAICAMAPSASAARCQLVSSAGIMAKAHNAPRNDKAGVVSKLQHRKCPAVAQVLQQKQQAVFYKVQLEFLPSVRP